MASTHHPFSRLLLIAALLALANGQLAHAQDDDEPVENAQADRALVQKQREHQLEGQRGRLKAQIESLLSRRLDELKRSCRLTEAQLEKLTLAGKGDIKRFMDRWDQITGKIEESRTHPGELRNLVLERNALVHATNYGFLGEDSFFSKILARTLDEEQAASYERALAEKRDRQGYVQIIRPLRRQLDNALAQKIDRQEDEQRKKLLRRQLAQDQDRWNAGFDRLLSRRLDELRGSCHLTQAQVKKLEIAGKRDIKRFMDRIGQIDAKLKDSRTIENDLRILVIEMNDLENKATAVFVTEDSFFSTTLAQTLDREQAAAHEQALAEKTRLQYEQAVARAIRSIQKNLVLSNRQAEELVQLILRDTRPPKRIGLASEIALVLFQVSRLPEHTIRPMFDDAQWQRLSHWVAAYKNGAGGEQVLKRHGFVFDDDRPSERPTPPEANTEPQNREG